MSDSIDEWWSGRTIALCLAILAIVPYLNTLGGDFVWDDIDIIRKNPLITGPEPSAIRLLTAVHDPGFLYRPLTMLTYRANALVHLHPFGFHLVNVLLHAAVTVLVFFLTRKLLSSAAVATATAVLFAVHPVHTEAVSNIVGRAELLAALFVLASLLAFMRSQESEERRLPWRATSLAAFVAAVLSKESGFTALMLYPVLDRWRLRTAGLTDLARAMVPYGTIAIAYLGWRAFLIGSLALPEKPWSLDNPLAYVSTPSRLATALVILWEYLATLVLPVHLSADHSFRAIAPVTTLSDARLVGALVVFGAIGIGLFVSRNKVPALVLSAAFAVIPMALTANILFPIGTIMAERLLYLPSLGFCMALGWATWKGSQAKAGKVVIVTFALMVSAYIGRTIVRNSDWNDNFTLFIHTVGTVPNSAKAQYNAGWAYAERDQLDAAMDHFRRALVIYPTYAEAAFRIGRIYVSREAPARALFWCERAIRLDWSVRGAHYHVGLLRYRLHDYTGAEAAFRAGLEANPGSPSLLTGLSLALHAQGFPWQARLLVAEVNPENDEDPGFRDHLIQARLLIDGRVEAR